MPKFDFLSLEKQTSAGRLYPSYLIYGTEHYFIHAMVDKITNVYKAETGAEVERHSAKGLDAISLIDGMRTVPMWSKGKLIIIDEIEKLSAGTRESLADYLEKPSPSAIIILTGEKLDGRSRLAKVADKAGPVMEAKTVYDDQIPTWISRECKEKGRAISQDASSFMAELVGRDLSAMAEAIEKIILYIGAKKLIELKDVETVLSDTSQRSIFDLTKAAGLRDIALATARLSNLLRNNEPPVVIVSMLARQWRLLLKTKELKRPDADAASALSLPPKFAKEYVAQAAKFTRRDLARGIKAIWKADIAIKSSKLPNETILGNLLFELIKN